MPKKQWPTKSLDKSDLLITQRVKRIFDQGNLTQGDLARELAVSQPHVSRLLVGKTAWQNKYLYQLTALYNVSINSLLLDPQEVPIVSLIENDEGFQYTATVQQNVWLGKAPAPPGEPNLAGLYCLQVKGNFFKPFFGPGSFIYAQKDGNDIQEDMLVIYLSENAYGMLRQVKFDHDTIILKSLSPSGKNIKRPKTHLRLLERVVWIKI
jgi:hypothetical protein